ncbi:hypothetical protein KO500_09415 [Cellulophaga baltica]|uniref:hypothetical protein n=1 Tax=Cellulophaga TaxID=104264 RepID=UPI001C072DB4|nr:MULTISPECIES: hypothetical protein [Cellulophaga]MBU2996654.1 hypothetical protein [Cellulophaga baltica]MDO6768048.1 hypothetical protein [Cellulophaga sp. 1_MG-2023]
MGFNLSGIAVNKNYKDNFEELQEELGWHLEKESDIIFETASSNWKEEGICDVYFSEEGTLLFISMDRCTKRYSVANQNVLTFALSETSMAFNLEYLENTEVKRSIMQIEDDRMNDEGDPLAVEATSGDTSDLIWNQIGVVLGKRFWDIDMEEKAVRYVFSSAPKKNENDEIERKGKIDSKTVLLKEGEVTCPRCLGDGHVNKDDIIRLNKVGVWGTGNCAYCNATGVVEAELAERVPVDLANLTTCLSDNDREKILSKDKKNTTQNMGSSLEEKPKEDNELSEFSTTELDMAFVAITQIPNARTNIEALRKMSKLLAEYKNRGIETPDKRSEITSTKPETSPVIQSKSTLKSQKKWWQFWK